MATLEYCSVPSFPHAQYTGLVPDLIASAGVGSDVVEGDVETESRGAHRGVKTHTGEDHRRGATAESQNVVGVGRALFDAAFQASGESELLGSQSSVCHLVRSVANSFAGGADHENGIVLGCKSGGEAAIEGVNNDPWKVVNRVFNISQICDIVVS